MSVDLILIGAGVALPEWGMGRCRIAGASVGDLNTVLSEAVRCSEAQWVLLWDASIPLPSEDVIREWTRSPADCVHAGLRLGMQGLPGIMRYASPCWMLDSDPDPGVECTSWKLTLRASLIKVQALRTFGGLLDGFESMDLAGLEMGHRWIRRGGLLRYDPDLIGDGTSASKPATATGFADEYRFAICRFGRSWALWAVVRCWLGGAIGLLELLRSWWKLRQFQRPTDPPPARPSRVRKWVDYVPVARGETLVPAAKVSVLVPTVDRYPYLRTLLGQLREQTVKPFEIIVIDQTHSSLRDDTLRQEFADLPLVWITQDEPGQCSSRNAGLRASKGDWILFIDDDDEVRPDLIELHLRNIECHGADVSCGVNEERDAGELPADFRFTRVSDVFPTNNSLVKRQVLIKSGLFDLAYNRRQRADHDIGCRMYRSGALMILNPEILVFHHHAPSGGLRKHKARLVTYGMSRNRVFSKALLSSSEIYLARRYFPSGYDRELAWISAAGTFSARGGIHRRLAKVCFAAITFPHTLWLLRARFSEAGRMCNEYPDIPSLPESER